MGLDKFWIDKLLRMHAGRAFAPTLPPDATFKMVIDEAQLLLYGGLGNCKLGREVHGFLSSRVHRMIERHGTTAYVFCMDDKHYVPVNKARLQKQRHEAKRRRGKAPYTDEEARAIDYTLDGAMPDDFDRVSMTPGVMKRFKAFITECILRLQLYTDRDQGIRAGVATHSLVVCGAVAREAAHGTSSQVFVTSRGDEGNQIASASGIVIGEAEAKVVHWALKAHADSVLIRCADRDVFPILMLNVHRLMQRGAKVFDDKVFWLDFRPANVKPDTPTHYYVNIIDLWRRMHAYFLSDPVWSTVSAPMDVLYFLVALEGSDFTPRFRQMGPVKWFDTFYKHEGYLHFARDGVVEPGYQHTDAMGRRHVRIDEAAAVRFVLQVFRRSMASRKCPAAKGELRDGLDNTKKNFAAIREFAQRGARDQKRTQDRLVAAEEAAGKKRKRAPTCTWPDVPDYDRAVARVRQALWVLNYWANSPINLEGAVDHPYDEDAETGEAVHGWREE